MQLDHSQQNEIQAGIQKFVASIKYDKISFNFITIEQILELYAQLSAEVLILGQGAVLPTGFTIPIGGKHYRFDGTVTEVS